MFRNLLGDEFSRRQRRNPRYSLRAFARDLGLHHGTLSQLLSGRRRPTPRVVRALGDRLGLDGERVHEHVLSETDAAVLAAIGRSAFRPDSRWLATRAGIPLDAVNVSLHRLLRLGLLTMPARDHWRTHG